MGKNTSGFVGKSWLFLTPWDFCGFGFSRYMYVCIYIIIYIHKHIIYCIWTTHVSLWCQSNPHDWSFLWVEQTNGPFMAGSASLHRYLGTSSQLPAHLPLSPLQSGGSLGWHQLAHVLQADPQFWTQAANLHEAPVGLDYFRLTFPILCGFCSGQDVQYVQLYWSSIYCWLLGNLRQDQTRHSCIQHPQLARELCPQPLHETAYQWICVICITCCINPHTMSSSPMSKVANITVWTGGRDTW